MSDSTFLTGNEPSGNDGGTRLDFTGSNRMSTHSGNGLDQVALNRLLPVLVEARTRGRMMPADLSRTAQEWLAEYANENYATVLTGTARVEWRIHHLAVVMEQMKAQEDTLKAMSK